MPVPRTQKTAETIESLSMPVTECGCWIWLEGTFGRMGYGSHGTLSDIRLGQLWKHV
jgi:hypothetical protein